MIKHFQIEAKNDTVEVYMYGYINSSEVSGKSLVNEISKYEGKYRKLKLYLNSNGGDVPEGIALFNILSRSKMEISIHVDGVAASMAAVLLQVPGAKRVMSKHAKLMLHSVSGGNWGSSEELRNTANMMDDFESSLTTIVAERTGLTKEEVAAKWFDGKDHWYNAEQALAEKLIDEIEDGKAQEPAKTLNNMHDVIDHYSKQIANFNLNSETMKIENVINTLGLPAGTTEEQVFAAIEAQTKKVVSLQKQNADLEAEKTALEAQVAQTVTDKITAMVEAAVVAKKITADQKPVYETLAKADFENTQKVLDSMTGYEGIVRQLNPDDNSVVKLTDEQKKFTYQDFQRHAANKLQEIKDKDPETYKRLYKEAFGNEPKA